MPAMGLLPCGLATGHMAGDMMAIKHDIKLANRLRSLMANPLPIARIIGLWHEELMLSREAQAASYATIRKHIKRIEALTTLTDSERHILARCEAFIASARASRRHYEADRHEASTHKRHIACGPAPAITGRGHYAVLKHNHKPSSYMDQQTYDGLYSHKIPIAGPGRIDQMACDISPTKPRSTDALAGHHIGHKASAQRYAADLTHALRRAGLKTKRGRRNRGKGNKCPLVDGTK